MTCVICNRPYEKGETFELTAAEKKVIGPDAPNTVSYCAACLDLLQNPATGHQVMRGLYAKHLKGIGVINPTKPADAFYRRLTKLGDEKARKPNTRK